MNEIIIAGFGGQGVLAAGVILANAGLQAELDVTWLPSYGAAVRGGTANCAVKVDSEEIGSPYVDDPDILVVFNEPSMVKFEGKVKPGGYMFMNSSLIHEQPQRDDITIVKVPATELASEVGNPRCANVFMLGVILSHTHMMFLDAANASLEEYFAPKGEKIIELNKRALKAGFEWKEV